MRDVEFLPNWYPKLRHRRQALKLQALATVAVVLALVSVTVAKRLDARHQANTTTQYADQLKQSNQQLARLDALLEYQRQLRRQARVISELGLKVDPTRLLTSIEDAMPPETSLTELALETQEQPAGGAGQALLPMDRRLMVRLQGVAPSDVQVATLLTELGKVKFLDDLAMTYSRDRIGDGRSMREFELTFGVNINAPVEDKP